MHFDDLITALWYASIATAALTLVRLLTGGIASRYAGLTGWAFLSASSSVVLLFFRENTVLYLRVITPVYILQAICQFILVRTLFRAHLDAYPGIGAFAQKLLSGLVAVSAVIAVFAIRQDWLSASTGKDWMLAGVRIIDTSFAVFLAAAGIFFARYRVPTRRNVVRLETGATIYFAAQALAFLALITIGKAANLGASLVVEAADFALFGYFALALSRAGETLAVPRAYNPAEQARVEALNREALRFAKQLRTAARKNPG